VVTSTGFLRGGSVPEEHFKFSSVIVDALANGSYLEVMSAFQKARAAGVDGVKFNSERGAWQLLSCSRNVVVAHVTVRSPDHTVGDRSQPQTGLR
jgi:hypothetical protein